METLTLHEQDISPEHKRQLHLLLLDVEVRCELNLLLGENAELVWAYFRQIYAPTNRPFNPAFQEELFSKMDYLIKQDNNLDDDLLALFLSYFYEYLVSGGMKPDIALTLSGHRSALAEKSVKNYLRNARNRTRLRP